MRCGHIWFACRAILSQLSPPGDIRPLPLTPASTDLILYDCFEEMFFKGMRALQFHKKITAALLRKTCRSQAPRVNQLPPLAIVLNPRPN